MFDSFSHIQITQYLYSDPFKHKNQLVNASIIEQEICKQILLSQSSSKLTSFP